MAILDDANKVDLAERARQLSEEAEELRKTPVVTRGETERKREANADLDRRLAEPLEKLRRLAR